MAVRPESSQFVQGVFSIVDLQDVTQRRAIKVAISFLLVYLSWQAFRWIPGSRTQVGNLFFLPVGAGAAFACWRASRRCSTVADLKWFWRFMAAAITCQLAGDTTLAIYSLVGAEVPAPSLADLFYLGLYPLMLLALLRVPVAPASRSQKLRLGLDFATIIGAGAMLIWYLVLSQVVLDGGIGPLQLATSVAYPVGDLGLVAGIGVAILRWSPPTLRRPLSLIAAGLAMFVTADVVYAHAQLHGGYSGGGPIDILWIGALLLFALAGASQRLVEPGTAEAAVPTREQSEKRVGWLPFAALGIGSLVLISAMWGEAFIPQVSIVLFAIGLAALIALRQYVTQREMIRLQLDLREAQTELVVLANHDALTATANRRVMGKALASEVERASRYRRDLSLLFLDIDHFKRINDGLGHAAGDAVLAEFASVLKSCLRPTDTLGRWGGEEFLVILPETAAEEAYRAAERARNRIEEHNFLLADGQRVTCSVGVASFQGHPVDYETLIDTADQAMYEAKRSGRNRVVSRIYHGGQIGKRSNDVLAPAT